MSSSAVIYIPSFVKIGSGVQKLIVGNTQTHKQTHRQHRDLISLLYFLNKESRLIKISLKVGALPPSRSMA
jgi:hypothetical protein